MSNSAVLNKKECKSCNEVFSLDNFYTDNGLPDKKRNICKECAKASANEWRVQNYKRKKASNSHYEIFKRDKKHKREVAKKRRLTPEGKLKTKNQKFIRKERVKANKFRVIYKDMKMIDRQSCWNCGTHKNKTIDHIIPLSRGGSHGIGNLMILCRTCNTSKHAHTIMEWRVSGRAKSMARRNQT